MKKMLSVAAAACTALAGCAVPVEEVPVEEGTAMGDSSFGAEGAGDVRTHEQALKNPGSEHPRLGNEGTARVRVLKVDGKWEDCSGQVISRDSVLTAAHCFDEAVRHPWAGLVDVKITHQKPDGGWQTYYDNWARVAIPSGFSSNRDKNDIAVLQGTTSFSHVDQDDVTGLVRYSNALVPQLYAYGHGYYQEGWWDYEGYPNGKFIKPKDDNQLRYAKLDPLKWHTSDDKYPKNVEWQRDPSDEHMLCQGDSGGPWKIPKMHPENYPQPILRFEPELSGLQFAVTRTSVNPHDSGCGFGGALATQVSGHDEFIRDIVEYGKGSCEVKNVSYYYWGQKQNTFSSLICW